MRTSSTSIVLLLCLSLFSTHSEADHNVAPINRSSFPKGFVFGAGSAAYQYEGGAFIEGKGRSIWDTFAHQHPELFGVISDENTLPQLACPPHITFRLGQNEKIVGRGTGDVADDMYHLYKEDVDRMKATGLDAFRFSISWSRVLPKGKASGGSNPAGVKYYNNLINDLLSNGLVPYVTLFHWDLPQTLEDEYGGFRSDKIVDDFRDYAEFCFKTFGDRVKHWFTLNEPYTFSMNGYATGTMAPGRCSNYIGKCDAGDSSTEPYIVAHHLILSHGTAVKLYREKYKPYQKGEIGVTLVTNWFVPLTMTTRSERAARRALDFMFGWFLHPMTHGDYPITMRSLVGDRLPKFTSEQSKLLNMSYDFLGVNYYTGNFASNAKLLNHRNRSITTDGLTDCTTVKNGVPIGTPTALNWLYVYPSGIRNLMLYIKDNYGNPPIFITENGMATANNESLSLQEALQDDGRIEYFYGHLSYLLNSIKEGANVKGYFQWSFLDDFEWDAGYSVRFGMYYVDYKNKLKRYPKYSAIWFKKFLHT